ncbi:hypothetical protein OE903_01315 [Bacillus sp. B6(2022)]|nr:hypothetical protein [Bacillus sp. B6(2022)]
MKVKIKYFVTGLIMTSVLFFAVDMEAAEHLQKSQKPSTFSLKRSI